MKTFAEAGIDTRSATSGEIDTTCPQCSPERKKSRDRCLSVNIDLGTWFCHHCGWSGGLSRDKPEIPNQRKTYRRPTKMPPTELPAKAFAYLRGRGITDDVIRRNRVGYGPAYMPQLEREVNAIQFAYYRDDELINVKYRDGKKNFRMEGGAERILYGLNGIDPECTIICEGEMDKLSLETAGYENSVSVPDGAPSPDARNYASKFDFLDADRERIQAVKQWIIAVDADPPGQRLEDELSRRLGREKCKRVVWPDGCKDANDVLVRHGPEVLVECIRAAQPYPIDGAFTVLDLSDKIDRLYEHGWEKGASTGWPSVDQFYTVRPGEFTVVTGIPNSGKSNLIDALTINLAREHGWHIAMFSPENQPLEDHMARVMQMWAGEPFQDGPTPRMTPAQKDAAKQWASEHFTWILPNDDADWTVDQVLEIGRQLVFRKGIRGLVIDPWNEMDHLRPSGMTETEYIAMALKRIRSFGRRYGVHVWVVAHPMKLYREKGGDYPVPTMYDISGSAHWRNKADNGICIWRDLGNPESQIVEIHVQKIRFRQIGRVGKAEIAYNHIVGTYHERSRAHTEIPPSYYDAGDMA